MNSIEQFYVVLVIGEKSKMMVMIVVVVAVVLVVVSILTGLGAGVEG